MKTKLKKLLAIMLAGVMVLSCTVFASATDPYAGVSMVNGEGAVDPEDTGDAAASNNGQTKYAGGSAQGIARSEGPLPADPIRLELPTVGARTLDMILDPHGLIEETSAARYSNNNDVTVDFTPDTTLYFLSTVSGGKYTYTNETQPLTITNKSNLPVGVDVTLRVDKAITDPDVFDFSFVADADSLADAEGAAMYLALKHGDDNELNAVADYEADADDNYAEIFNPPTVEITSTDALYAYIGSGSDTAAGAYPKATFQWAKQADGTDLDDDTKGEIQTELATAKNITVTYVAAVAAVAADPDATPPVEAVAAQPAKLTIAAADIGDYAAEIITEGIPGKTEITNTTRDVSVAVRYYAEATEADNTASPPVEATEERTVAYVYFVIKAGALGQTLTAGPVATLAVTAGDDEFSSEGWAYAKFTTSIEKPEGAYVKGWDANGYFWAFVEEYAAADNTTGQAQLKAWGHEGMKAPTEYPSLSFSIVGSINGSKTQASPWDGNGSDIKLDLIWDVFAVEGEVESSDKKPAVTVTTPATSTSGTTAKKATISWTDGEGKYEGYAPVKVTSDGGDITISNINATAHTFQMTASATNKTYANTKVLFQKDDSSDVEIELSGWYTGT